MLTSAVLGALGALTLAASASAEGSFVIGNSSAAVGSTVTFWGAHWWTENSLSSGLAPASFKGYAETSGTPECGGSWSTRPGNSSSPPPGPLPEYIDVIVSSEIAKSGPTISGNVVEVVVVKTESGYAPDPGHAGTGTVVEALCPGGGVPVT